MSPSGITLEIMVPENIPFGKATKSYINLSRLMEEKSGSRIDHTKHRLCLSVASSIA